MEERNNRLLNAKLNKYIIPGIMMSLALQLGNIVDTIFVSNLIGVEAMSAAFTVIVAFPAFIPVTFPFDVTFATCLLLLVKE